MPVTRVEIADVVGPALLQRPHAAAELVSAAVAAGARPAVIEALHRLPDRSYADLRSLWPYLLEMPVEA